MDIQTNLLLENQQLKAELEKLRQENTALRQELQSLNFDTVQLEGSLLEERIKATKREETFKFIQLLYQEIISATDACNIYQITVKYLAENIGFDRAVIFKKSENNFIPVAVRGYPDENLAEKLANPFFSQFVKRKKGILVNSKTTAIGSDTYQSNFQVKYFIAVPFAIHDEVNHILFAGNQTEDNIRRPRLTRSDLQTLQILANQIAIAIRQTQLYSQSLSAVAIAQAQSLKIEQALHKVQQTQAQLIQTEKMSGLGQLVAGLAHEINNPINFIHGNLNHASNYVRDLLDLLTLYQQQYPNPTAPIQEQLDTIDWEFLIDDLPKVLSSMRGGAQRIRQIILSLRNFSRHDEADIKRVNIHEGIDNTLLILQHRLKATNPYKRDIQIIKDYGELPPVECYPGQLNQVFMNVIANAIDALEELQSARSGKLNSMPKGIKIGSSGHAANSDRSSETVQSKDSFSPCIRIRTEVLDSGYVAISIADNGPGMTEEVRNRLFDPFFTTKPVGKGTGLGLTISYQIVVEKHRGILRCFSEPAQGAEFCIQIPIKAVR
ncbi:ATP-binding protein [Microcoleus sp. FACHB-831]|uniref:ATP-binding protein n=1 Tax=Microcoleus sp. FACHB-831 TaxID=2692827 RepID=UPI001F54C184|nr:ATP-binding protein [Microcoleus sp. FACHB-831]